MRIGGLVHSLLPKLSFRLIVPLRYRIMRFAAWWCNVVGLEANWLMMLTTAAISGLVPIIRYIRLLIICRNNIWSTGDVSLSADLSWIDVSRGIATGLHSVMPNLIIIWLASWLWLREMFWLARSWVIWIPRKWYNSPQSVILNLLLRANLRFFIVSIVSVNMRRSSTYSAMMVSDRSICRIYILWSACN